jgi:hypothetical protein
MEVHLALSVDANESNALSRAAAPETARLKASADEPKRLAANHGSCATEGAGDGNTRPLEPLYATTPQQVHGRCHAQPTPTQSAAINWHFNGHAPVAPPASLFCPTTPKNKTKKVAPWSIALK